MNNDVMETMATMAATNKETKEKAPKPPKEKLINGVPESEFKGYVVVTSNRKVKELIVNGTMEPPTKLLERRKAKGETFVISPSVNHIMDYLNEPKKTKGMGAVVKKLESKLKDTDFTVTSFLEEMVAISEKLMAGETFTYFYGKDEMTSPEPTAPADFGSELASDLDAED